MKGPAGDRRMPSASVVKLRGVPMAIAPWIVSDELWELIEPLAGGRSDGFATRVGSAFRTGSRCKGFCSCSIPGSRGSILPQELGFGSGCDLLAADGRVAEGRRLGAAPRGAACAACERLVRSSGRGRSLTAVMCRRKRGLRDGPEPGYRARNGSKHHLLVDATGIPLAWTLTGGNRHDSTQLIALVDRVPPVRGKVGRPRRRPDRLCADRGYDYDVRRRELRQRGINPRSPAAKQSTAQALAAIAGSLTDLRLAPPVQTTARPLRPSRRHP